jgi:hypothetical protein
MKRESAEEFITGELDRLFTVERNYLRTLDDIRRISEETAGRLAFCRTHHDLTVGFEDQRYWDGKIDAYSTVLSWLEGMTNAS